TSNNAFQRTAVSPCSTWSHSAPTTSFTLSLHDALPIYAGIVVVAVDVAAKGAQATVTLDNHAAGEEACTYLFEELDGSGNILIVDGTPITSVQDRMEGCETVMEEDFPDIEVLAHQNGDNGRQEALSLTQDM